MTFEENEGFEETGLEGDIINNNIRENNPTGPKKPKNNNSEETPFTFEEALNEDPQLNIPSLGGVSDSQYNTNLPASAFEDPRKLEQVRGSNQPWHHELANGLTRTAAEMVGGAVEGFGILADTASGQALSLDSENMLVELGEFIKDSTNEAMPIYKQDRDANIFESETFFDILPSLGSTISMMVPSMAVTKGLSYLGKLGKLSKGARVLKNVQGLTKSGKFIANGFTQATISRQIESTLEAKGIYDELIQEGYSEEEAKKAAKETYSKNWLMLAQDIPQYLALGKVFNPLKGTYGSTAKKAFKSEAANKALKLTKVSGSEAGEEAFQFLVGDFAKAGVKVNAGDEEFKSFSERVGSAFGENEFWNSVVMGALGGGVFQGVGETLTNISERKNRDKNIQITKDFTEARGKMMNQMFEYAQQADKTGDEKLSTFVRKKLNQNLVQKALLSDNYESHVEWLEALQNASNEELAEMSEKYGMSELNGEVIKQVVPKLIKESESVKNDFFKLLNKYDAKTASQIASNKLDIQHANEIKKDTEEKISDLKTKIPNFETLSTKGREIFENEAEKKAIENQYQIKKAKAVQSAKLTGNDNIKSELDQIQKTKEKKLAQLEKIEDDRSNQEKQNDKPVIDLLNGSENEAVEYVTSKAENKQAIDEISSLSSEINSISKPKAQREKEIKTLKNKINSASNVETLSQVKEEAIEKGTLKDVKKNLNDRYEQISEELNKDLTRIANKMLESSDQPSTKNLNDRDTEVALSNKEKLQNIFQELKEKKYKTDPKFTEEGSLKTPTKEAEVEQQNYETNLNRELDPYITLPPKRHQNPNLFDWLETPIDVSDYVAKVEHGEHGIKITFIDQDGNLVKHKGEILETGLYKSKAKGEPLTGNYKFLVDKLNEIVEENGVAYVKVKGKSDLDIAKYDEIKENEIFEVFGEDVEFAYVDKSNKYIQKNGNKKIKISDLKADDRSIGRIFAIVRNNNNKKTPIKLNRSKLTDQESDLIYELYNHALSEGVKINDTVPVGILTKLKEYIPEYEEVLGENPTIEEVLDFFVYDAENTKNYPEQRLMRHVIDNVLQGVYFGGTEVDFPKLTKDNSTEQKENFKTFLKENKRFNVNVNSFYNNKKYKEWLIKNKKLNTEKEKGNIFREIEPRSNYNKGLLHLDTDMVGYNEADVRLTKTESTPTQSKEAKKAEIERKIQEVINNKNFIKLSEDGKYYINTKTGKKYKRVSDFISEDKPDPNNKLVQSSLTIGTKVDELVRDFFADELKDLSEYDVSSLAEIENFLEQLKKVKNNLAKRGETVLANDIVLYNDELGIAGTVDLLTYDTQGNIRIYDMKTMRGNNFTEFYGDGVSKYETTKYGKSKRQKHTEQISLYRILLNNTHKLKAKTIGVMPIEISYNSGDTKTTKLNLLKGVQLTFLDKVKTAELKALEETTQSTTPTEKVSTDELFGKREKDAEDFINSLEDDWEPTGESLFGEEESTTSSKESKKEPSTEDLPVSQKEAVEREGNIINYTKKGQDKPIEYVVIDNKIYNNKTKKEVFKTDSKDRRKILFKNAFKLGNAKGLKRTLKGTKEEQTLFVWGGEVLKENGDLLSKNSEDYKELMKSSPKTQAKPSEQQRADTVSNNMKEQGIKAEKSKKSKKPGKLLLSKEKREGLDDLMEENKKNKPQKNCDE